MSQLIGIMLFLFVEMVAPAHADPLGRLFFSSSERSQLELQENKQLTSINRNTILTVNGIIKRNDGSRIVWINGKMQESTPEKSPNTVRVPIPGKPDFIDIAVGQRIVIDREASVATNPTLAPGESAP